MLLFCELLNEEGCDEDIEDFWELLNELGWLLLSDEGCDELSELGCELDSELG